jgi:hypothetical protein
MARFNDRQQAPPRPPMQQPPGSRPRKPADPALQQRSFAAVMLAVLSLFGIMMMSGNVRRTVFVVALTLIISLIALWLAVSAMSAARTAGSSRPRGAILATVLGVFGCLFSGLVLIGFAMFWPQLTRYSDCLSGAGTVAAQQVCQQQLTNSVRTQIGILGG